MRVTHCKRRHAFDYANTYIRKSGSRQCRACANGYKIDQRIKEVRQMELAQTDKVSLGTDRLQISATCEQLDALLPGTGNLVKRLRKVLIENRQRIAK